MTEKKTSIYTLTGQISSILLSHSLYMSPEMFARSIELYRERYSIVFLGFPGIVVKTLYGRKAEIKLGNVHMQHNGSALMLQY